jgi:hypothetical protein
VCLIAEFGQDQQIVSAEAPRPFPFITAAITAIELSIVESSSIVGRIFEDGDAHTSDADTLNGCVVFL